MRMENKKKVEIPPKITNMVDFVSKKLLFYFGYKQSGSKCEAGPVLCQE